jgi:uncharacterized membrane protein YcaP (DUF421 family)
MLDLLDQVLGLSLKSEQLGFGHMAARAFVMYLALIVIVRSAKKRFLSNATAFDFILTVMVGAIAARALTGGAPFFASLLALLVLVWMHWFFSAASRGSPTLSSLLKGNATVVIRDGKVDERAMAASHISMDDLQEDLRGKGVREPAEVAEARLERSGKLSVIKKSGS